MEIYIQKEILIEALQLIVNITPKTTSEPIINNVLLETESENGNHFLLVKATNYENSFSGRFEVEPVQPGKICVNAYKLYNLVREFRGNRIFIHSTPQNWVFLTSNSSNVKLPGIDPEHFPVIEFKCLSREIHLPGEYLKTAIERIYFAIGENESRRSLMGLNLEITSQNLIHWTGADAFRICYYNTELREPVSDNGNIIIPKKSLAEIKRIIDFSDQATVTISFDDNTFQIVTPQIQFKTSLIEAEYPNLKSLINSDGLHEIVIPKDEMTNAVRILNTVTDGDINSIMKFTPRNGNVLLESQKLEFGEGNDEIPCEYDGKEMSIGLNIRFFLDALQVFDTSNDEMIRIKITNPEAPLIIVCDEWKNFKTILMPVRIQW